MNRLDSFKERFNELIDGPPNPAIDRRFLLAAIVGSAGAAWTLINHNGGVFDIPKETSQDLNKDISAKVQDLATRIHALAKTPPISARAALANIDPYEGGPTDRFTQIVDDAGTVHTYELSVVYDSSSLTVEYPIDPSRTQVNTLTLTDYKSSFSTNTSVINQVIIERFDNVYWNITRLNSGTDNNLPPRVGSTLLTPAEIVDTHAGAVPISNLGPEQIDEAYNFADGILNNLGV